MVVDEDFLRTRIDAIVSDGLAQGTFSENWVSFSPIPVPETMTLTAEFADLFDGARLLEAYTASLHKHLRLGPGDVLSTIDQGIANALGKTEIQDIDARLGVHLDSIPIGTLGYLRAAAQAKPQLMLVVTGSTEQGVKVDLAVGALSLQAVAWDQFVANLDGVVIDAVVLEVTFDSGVTPRSVSGKILRGHIDALKLFGAPKPVTP
jgi:hypothetical protein